MYDAERHRLVQLVEDSTLARIPEMLRTLGKDSIGPAEKASHVAGVVARDILTDGSRRFIWYFNHPMAQVAAAGEAAALAAGMEPDYGERAKALRAANRPSGLDHVNDDFAEERGWARNGVRRSGIPMEVGRFTIPALAAGAMLATSGNHDFLNILGGGRPAGHAATLPVPGNPTQSSNPLGELAVRYLFGRQGDLLPWDQFTRERPDVGPTDYRNYRAHQWDGGLLDLGLFKATSRNLEGEPEYTMMGFRVPLSAAGTAGGAAIGAAIGANAVSDAVGKAIANEALRNKVKADRLPEWIPRQGRAALSRWDAPRRMAGALLGAAAGAVAGNVGTKALNAAVIQPMLHPAEVAAQRQWEEAQRALGVL